MAKPAAKGKAKGTQAEKARAAGEVDEGVMSPSELADYIGVSIRHLSELEAKGIVTKLERGLYDAHTSIFKYIRFLKGKDRIDEATGEKKADASLRREIAEADKAELTAREMRGELINVGEIEEVFLNASAVVRSRFMGIGPKLAQRVAVLSRPAEIERVISAEVDAILSELAGTDIPKPPTSDSP